MTASSPSVVAKIIATQPPAIAWTLRVAIPNEPCHTPTIAKKASNGQRCSANPHVAHRTATAATIPINQLKMTALLVSSPREPTSSLREPTWAFAACCKTSELEAESESDLEFEINTLERSLWISPQIVQAVAKEPKTIHTQGPAFRTEPKCIFQNTMTAKEANSN